ncbi:alkaline phosphatase family protein [Mucilaginibacter sp.]|uniref:alkaline phosphatase family protein n=1 Tax=Mucilaginibacter sp. TaxID=1882438 RepID=UPI002611F0EF|nr:alkaline phosphatase family protein [Mucilaginibacter sp.]
MNYKLTFSFLLIIGAVNTSFSQQHLKLNHVVPKQPVVMIMMDGFGKPYLDASDMPVLKSLLAKGLYKIAKDMTPSVTNCNNAAICTGTFPEVNGIVGNSFYNYKTNEEELMEDSSLVMAPTIFTRAAKYGVKSALISSKLKTIHLLAKGTTIAISPEIATEEWTNAIGLPPDKYSSEVNYWTFNAAIHLMKTRPDIGLYYIHTTDYPMHMWEPGDARSKLHLHTIDSLLGVIVKTLPNAAIFITADHGMNYKSKVWDITKALANRGLPIKLSISASKDLYPKHHLGFGGCVYVYLNKAADTAKAKKILLSLPGIETVYTRREAVVKFHEMASRIGDLVVLGDKNTVLGEATTETETLAATYRSHGSVYEEDVPLIIYNIPHPAATYFKYNKDLLRWLY